MRINWILPRANLSGGTKMVRQLAEHLQTRGHTCTIAHLQAERPWPPPWRVRSFARRVALAWQLRAKEEHHLTHSRVPTLELPGEQIEARDVPEADVTIATWWETMEWVRDWPASRGRLAYYIQHHELFGGDPERVRATYRVPALQIVIARWLEELMRREYGARDVVLVRNGLDFAQFDAPPRARSWPPTVGLMYSNARWKRTDLAFAAIEIVRKTLPDLRVISFGSMPPAGTLAAPA